MTRKDYKKLAAALHAARPSGQSAEARELWVEVVDRIAEVLAADNGRFDDARFQAACRGV